MTCPYCGHSEQRVLDSRAARDGSAIRRRRECCHCDRRFTTFEEPERPRLFVVKRDGTREDFDREKIFDGMRIACRKRPISVEQLRAMACRIEQDLLQELEDEVESEHVGERVLEALLGLDAVAWVRFASVYRDFQTVAEFREIVESLSTAGSKAKSRISGADAPLRATPPLRDKDEAVGSGRSSL
ncbi:MAG TPA: transcriptional regulator NrdR [Fimbriimonadaceae bacterium]|nr:transcriptional regulator NrdR [Fimbriimonadaceae bacterium]HRJ32786.1 transcriptional regulator NrdR [Fimbriimonadaceae bacterium]